MLWSGGRLKVRCRCETTTSGSSLSTPAPTQQSMFSGCGDFHSAQPLHRGGTSLHISLQALEDAVTVLASQPARHASPPCILDPRVYQLVSGNELPLEPETNKHVLCFAYAMHHCARAQETQVKDFATTGKEPMYIIVHEYSVSRQVVTPIVADGG